MRVNIVQKASVRVAAKNFHCGQCGKLIEPGMSYKWAKGRYTARKIRCAEHNFRRSDLTDAIWGEAQSAVEAVEDAIAAAKGPGDWESVNDAFEALKESAEEVRSQYEQAAEPFQGQGENAERAEQMQDWISELEGVDEYDFEDDVTEDCGDCEGSGTTDCETCGGSGLKEEDERVGTDDDRCQDCMGGGTVTCEQCNGEGTLTNEEPESSDAYDTWIQSIEDAIGSFPF